MNYLQAGQRINDPLGRSLHLKRVFDDYVIPVTRGILLKIALVALGVGIIGNTQAGELTAGHDQAQLPALVVSQEARLPGALVSRGEVAPPDGGGQSSPGVVSPLEPVVKEPGNNTSAKADDGSGGGVEQDSEQRVRYGWQIHLGILLVTIAAGWFVPPSAIYFLLSLLGRLFRR
nr:hypothetical protein [uncultured Rhodoferax sp.]